LPIAGVRVNFVNSDGGANGTVKFTSGLTDALGHYPSDGGTATGNVFAFTTNDRGYQDDVYNQVHCPNCDVTTLGTLIPVTLESTTANINFALDLGSSIAGTVTNVSATPLAGIEVDIADSTGNTVDQVFTDASGNYTTSGHPAGNYFAYTRHSKSLGLVDQLYNNITCINGNCDAPSGTAIPVTVGATTPGKNFVLSPGGTITGTVTRWERPTPTRPACTHRTTRPLGSTTPAWLRMPRRTSSTRSLTTSRASLAVVRPAVEHELHDVCQLPVGRRRGRARASRL
jgi:hypothetical protein